jgi:hypothetical protein
MTIAPGVILPESEIAAICRRYQVKELALFGSAARGCGPTATSIYWSSFCLGPLGPR